MMLSRASVSGSLSLVADIPVGNFSVAVGDGTPTIDVTAKTMSLTYGTNTTALRGSYTVEVAKRYRVSWVYSGTSGMSLYAGSSAGGTQYRPPISGDLFFDFTATTTTLSLSFQRTATGTTTVSQLKITQIPEVSWTDTALINKSGWALAGTVTVDTTSGAITLAATGTAISARQGVTTTAGALYRLRWNNSQPTQCLIGTSNGGSQMKTAVSSDTAGDKTYEFRATTTSTWIQFQRSTTGTAVVSNIFVQSIA